MKKKDGSPYQPATAPLNTHKNCAFDPSKVPDPSHETVPLWSIFKFMAPMLNPVGAKFQEKDRFLFVNNDEAEIVPITWE